MHDKGILVIGTEWVIITTQKMHSLVSSGHYVNDKIKELKDNNKSLAIKV